MAKQKRKTPPGSIVVNRKARHDYELGETFEAGLVLNGWEVKSLRAGKAQLVDSFVQIDHGEAWLHGAHIPPLSAASTHVIADPTRIRKLLLHKKELARLFSASANESYTAICLSLYWKRHMVKAEIAVAKGKKQYDKRATLKQKDWDRQKQRLMKSSA